MTVKDLIEKLKTFPPDYEVITLDADGREESGVVNAVLGKILEIEVGEDSFVQDEPSDEEMGCVAIYTF